MGVAHRTARSERNRSALAEKGHLEVHHTRRSVPCTLEPSQGEALQGLVRSLPQTAGLLLDEKGRIAACGPALPDFLPHPHELLHTAVAEIRPHVLGESISKLWGECRRSGEPALTEIAFSLDPTQEADPISASLRVARHPDSQSACVVTVRDVSRDKGRVQVLLDHIDLLERRTKDWEAAVQTARHDVISSLAALKGFIDLTLRQDGLPAAAADNLHLAREIAAQVGAIAERVRAPAAEALPEVPVALEPLVHRLLRALHAAHPEVSFTWWLQAPDVRSSLPTDVLWDVLWNLLSNCVKYRHGDRPLHIELRAGFEGGRVWIEVRDNGLGMPPGEEEAVFQRGRRGSNVGQVPGSGLGLYSARRLLGRYGGTIRAERNPNGAIVRAALSGWMTSCPTQGDISPSDSVCPNASSGGSLPAPARSDEGDGGTDRRNGGR